MVAQWRRSDKELAASSGGREGFGELEQICNDLVTEIDDVKAERPKVQDEIKDKGKSLHETVASICEMAMERYGPRVPAEDESDGEVSEPSSVKKAKKRRCDGGFEQGLQALQGTEKHRMDIAEKIEGREEKRYELEERRFLS